jgi:hypothetical protein
VNNSQLIDFGHRPRAAVVSILQESKGLMVVSLQFGFAIHNDCEA